MASSSAIQLKKHYDVFISFRGTDTRKNFTSHLLAALKRHKIDTYIDYRLERGDEIKKSLRTAIKKSKICVIIFSQDYASSPWCLDELAYIMERKERYEGLAIPIFHEMNPSHVRHQTGDYATVFAKHEERFEDSQVLKWRAALTKAANLSGFDSTSSNVRDDSDLVEQVVIDISKKLNRGSSRDLTGLVGIESRIQQVVQELDIIPEDCRIRFVVIWGMGGIGKTTLADAVFHRLYSQFEGACFLANVREKSQAKGVVSPQLYRLRDKLLRKLLGEETPPMESQTIDSYYKERLQCTKVLVVLDDVNDSVQLEFLAGDQVPFGPGSRIIITTRDRQRVREMQVVRKGTDHDVKIYKIEELNGDESLQLFYSNAPRESRDVYSPEFLKKVVDSAAGIPLALKIWHPLFLRCKRKEELEELWNKMKKFPNKDLHNVYRVSYDVLEENEREVFLDIVCFHKGEGVRSAKRALDACGLFADSGINILIDMSLISIKGKTLWMHDVIQEMGWEIVREQGTKEPGGQRRLYTRKDVCHVLERNTGTGRVRSIALCRILDDSASLASQILTGSHTNQDFLEKYKALLTDQDFIHNHNIKLTPQAFTGMHNLTFLKVEFAAIHLNDKAYLEFLPDSLRYLHWDAYPWKSLPSKFSPKNLVELSMRLSKLQKLWNKGQNPQHLTRIDLRYSVELVEVPDMSKSLDIDLLI
ncbi:PREDICTED: TMV resistance protein N-like [Fragaria vesca subsp. vesca]